MITVKLIKNIAAISAGFMILGVGANAEDLKFYESVMQNGDYSFIVEGYAPSLSKNEEVNIMIFNPGYALEEGKNIYGGEYLQYQTFATTTDGGYFKVEVPIYLDGVNDSGDYICYVGGEAFEEAKNLSVYFASIEDRKNAVEKIKNSTSADILSNLEAAEKDLALSGELYNAVDKEKLAELVLVNKDLLDKENPAESAKLIRSLALLEAYNEGLDEYAVSGTEFINTDIIDFSSVDEDGATFYSKGYKEILSTEGKNRVIDSLMKNGYKTLDELYDDFRLNVVMQGIKYSETNGTGHIDELLTDENVKALDLDIPLYLAITSDSVRSKANSAIKKASFSDKESLENAIETVAKNAKSAQSTGGGGGGGSASAGGSSMQIIIGDNKVDLNQNIVDNDALNEEIFTDLESVEWAKEAIITLYEKGIVSGVGNKLYAPENNVTREQFIVMIMRALEIEATETGSGFSDVQLGTYYEKYVATAKKLGIINGISQDLFGTGRNITRQDLAVMVINAVKYKEMSLEGSSTIAFADAENISDYAKDAVDNLVKAGVINGFSDNTFRPKNNCTRAQAAKIIYEIVKGADE